MKFSFDTNLGEVTPGTELQALQRLVTKIRDNPAVQDCVVQNPCGPAAGNPELTVEFKKKNLRLVLVMLRRHSYTVYFPGP